MSEIVRWLVDRLQAYWRPVAAAAVCLYAVGIFMERLEPHYAISDWLFWPVALLWVYMLLYTTACVGIGHVLLRRVFKVELPVTETWLASKCVGLVVFVLGLYVAGTLSAFHPIMAVSFPLTLIAISLRDLRILVVRTIADLQEPRAGPARNRLIYILATGAGAIGFAILYAIAFSPQAISLDAAWYHLPIAQDYARAGAIVPFPSEYNRAFPHLSSMIYTWGMLMPGLERPFTWMMALHLEFTILVWKVVSVAVATQWMLGDTKIRGMWTGYLLYPLVFAFAHSITGGAEHFVGLWTVPMLLATARLLKRFDLRWAALLGVFSGGAILSKYQAIYMIGGCGSMLVFRWLWLVGLIALRKELPCKLRRLWQVPLVILGIGLTIASPHFIKNMLFYGDPMYPFLQAKLSSAHPTHPLADYLFHAKLGAEANRPTAEGFERLEEAWRLFWEFSFEPHYVVVKKKWPLIGSLFTLLLPTLLFLRRGTLRTWMGVWCCFVTVGIWANTYLQDRYLNVAVPLFTAVTMVILVRLWNWNWLTRWALVPIVGLQIAWNMDAFVFTGEKMIASSLHLGKSGWDGRLEHEERYPWRQRFEFVNEATPEDAKVLVRGTREVLGLDRYALRDVQWQQAYFFYGGLQNAAEVWQYYKDRGVTHVVWRKHSPFSGSMQSAVLFADMVHRANMPVTQTKGWALMTMPPQPANVEGPLMVAVFGLRPLYADGLYQASDLGLFGMKDRKNRGGVKPREAAKGVGNLEAFVERVDVVVLGTRLRLKPEASSALNESFVQHNSLKKARLFLRRLEE